MTQNEFDELCRDCSRTHSSSECIFAEGVLGFIDCSALSDGSRGIAFFGKKMSVNFDGTIKNVAYCKIRSVQIISSLEDPFADELDIFGERSRLRISDYSLDKIKLSGLIEKIRSSIGQNGEIVFEREPEELIKTEIPVIPEQAEVTAEENSEQTITEEKIEWLNSIIKINEKYEKQSADTGEEKIEWLSENKDEKITETTAENSFDENASEIEERHNIEKMSREETLDYLNKMLSEINSDDLFAETEVKENSSIAVSPTITEIAGSDVAPREEIAPKINNALSVEPMWGDIYIKASRTLRELCESGILTMGGIEKELRQELLEAARAFSDIISDEQKVPKVLVPRIAELKNASCNFEEYFSYGEDIGVRVMFFMLYQMLSYADRIAESPDTKERLNNFFRRFGTAGISLSMLDVRV